MRFRFVLPLPPFILHPPTLVAVGCSLLAGRRSSLEAIRGRCTVDTFLEGCRRAGRRVRVRGAGVASSCAKERRKYTIFSLLCAAEVLQLTHAQRQNRCREQDSD